ncbi:hypothetical protein ACS0TY_015244 [Phlomoides rotata]
MNPNEEKSESSRFIQPNVIKLKEEEEEEDEDLFEINLEIFNKIPPPQYEWESYFTAATSNTLLANCLLPIADVSCAVPMTVSSGNAAPPWLGTTEDKPMVQYVRWNYESLM